MIVGAGLLSHAPVIMFPDEVRRNYTLATGLDRLNADVFAKTDYDAVVVIDSHWITTTEFVVTSAVRRSGFFTSSEMPTLLKQIPYDMPGLPSLAAAMTDMTAVDDPYLPIQYGTLNLWKHLARPYAPWLSVSVCQTATVEDYLNAGRAIAKATGNLRVLLIASGGLSHVFHPLQHLRDHMRGDPRSIVSAEARAADEQRIAWMLEGRHDDVVRTMPDYMAFEPEARFGHYLMLAGAVQKPGVRYSNYENGIGTGQVHVWFPCAS